MSRRAAGIGIATACLLGLGLRLNGLGYGLPAIYNMDEVAIMNRALAFGTGDFNPHNFLYPTFYFYALFAWQGLTFVIGWMAGVYDSVAAFQREFFVDPSRLYWSGRLLSTLCGVATIAGVGALATRLFGRPAGVVAALCMAAAPIAVQDAHYVKHDVPVTLLIVLTHLLLARLLPTGAAPTPARPRDLISIGALAGLAMSTHYYAVFVTLPVATLVLTQAGASWRRRWVDALWVGLSAAVVFVAASPFLLSELGTAWVDITQNRAIVMDRATQDAGSFASLGRYLVLLVQDGLGWPVALLGMAGLLSTLRNGRQAALLLLFPVVFLLFISNTVPASRYLNPILPFLAIGAGAVLAAVLHHSHPLNRHPAITAVALAVVVTAPGLSASLRLGNFFRQPDTRSLAQAWFEREVPAESTVLIQPYSVPLRQSRAGLVEALRHTQGSEDRASIKFQLQLALSPYPSPAYRTIYLGDGGLDADKIYVSPRSFDEGETLAPLRELAVQYVVVKRYNAPDPSLAPLDRALARGGRLIATFSPYRSDVDPGRLAAVAPFLHNTDARLDPALERPGPVIEIWRID